MPHPARPATVTWVALLALTLVSFALSDAAGVRAAALPILLAATVKVSLVGFQFMELRSAHVAWRAAFTGLVAVIVIALLVSRSVAT